MLLAVYGTLKQGHPNHRVLEGALYVGDVTLHGYDMYNVHGAYPAVTYGEGSIKCELYEVESFDALDGLEGFYGEGNQHNLYNRVAINIEEGQRQVVYIYLYNRNVANLEQVDTGEWTNDWYNRGKCRVV